MEQAQYFAIYVRVSSAEQAQSKEGSIASQEQRCREYLHFKYGDHPIVVYKEEGKSGKDTNRPEYQKLVCDIRRGRIQAVCCTELSRISRSVLDFHQFLAICNEHEVGFISLREQFDTTTAHGKLMMSIFASVAQFEREQISERTSANLQARARRGLWNGGYIHGYRPRPGQKGYLDVDTNEAIVINLIFDKYLETGSYCQITEWLNRSGYWMREYISSRGKHRQAKPWHKDTVLRILRNPAYIGKRKEGNEFIDCVWAPIVTLEKWETVQLLLAQNYTIRQTQSTSPKRHVFLLGGLLRCTNCDTFLETGAGTGNTGKVYYYYRHPKGKKKCDCPIKSYLPASEVERLVYTNFVELATDEELLQMVCDEVSAKFKSDMSSLEKQKKHIENQIDSLESEGSGFVQKLSFLDESQIREFILPRLKDISDRKKSLLEEKQKIESELLTVGDEVIDPCAIKSMVGSLATQFDGLTDGEKKMALRTMIGKVDLFKDKIGLYVYAYNKNYLESFEKVQGSRIWLPERILKRTIFLYMQTQVTQVPLLAVG